jgi:hypothetical protein
VVEHTGGLMTELRQFPDYFVDAGISFPVMAKKFRFTRYRYRSQPIDIR